MTIAVPVALVAAGILALGARQYFAPAQVQSAGTYMTVQPMAMDVKISKDGELAAVNNIDINCMVEGQSTIQTIVKEGSFAKKGDILVTLDSSQIKQRIEDTTLDVEKAEADVTSSREMREIQVSKNSADTEAANVSLNLAKLDLLEYTEGTYPQDVANAQTTLDMARITLKNKEEDFSQTTALFNKGFVTATQVKEDELAVVEARNAVRKADTALRVLTQFSHAGDLESKKNALAQAEQKLIRTQRENASNLSQRDAELRAKEQTLAAQKRRLEKYQEQLAACTVAAPAEGLVVYGSSQDRWSNTQIQEGAQVRERQMLIRLPDTTQMKAVVRIQEQQVSKLQIGQRALVRIVGLANPVPATLTKISVLSDSSQRWWNPDLKEYPIELTLDKTPPNLKPGIGVMTEIFITRLDDVVAVPLAAVYSVGNDAYVFTRDGARARPTKVTLGQVNETHAQIVQGLTAGQDVLLLQVGQGRQLLEDAGIKVQPTTKPAAEKLGTREKPAAVAGPGLPKVQAETKADPAALTHGAPAADAAKPGAQTDAGAGNRSGGRRRSAGAGAATPAAH
jgi:multidrug efflux pump subunit AcrA (membrane-fusion protein)